MNYNAISDKALLERCVVHKDGNAGIVLARRFLGKQAEDKLQEIVSAWQIQKGYLSVHAAKRLALAQI